MNKQTKTFIGILLFIVFLGIAYFAYSALIGKYQPNNQLDIVENPAEENQEYEPIAAPDFTVFDSEGNEVKLSDFLGKPVVLNFWASWCPPCKSEMPHFDTVYSDLQDDIVFIMVDIVDGKRETQAKGQAYVDKQGFSFPIYFDLDQSVAIAYGVNSIPTTLIIDAEGYLITGFQGAIDEKALRNAIDTLN